MNTSDKIPGEQTEWFEMADLIAKRMAGALTREEEERLEAWYGTSAHHRDLYERICSDETLREKIRMYGSSKVEAAFVQFLERRRRMARRRWLSAARYAAVLVVALLAGLWYAESGREQETRPVAEVVTEAYPAVKRNMPVLTLGNGEEVELNQEALALSAGNGVQITMSEEGGMRYKVSDSTREEMVYNTMTTPVQCDFMFTLEDGTRVWLNAASSLRYPVAFGKDERVVYAEGEIYLEVAKDAKRPFYVELKNGMRVKVLGTSFNVIAYAEESFTEVTLVEGRVETYAEGMTYVLQPSEQLHFDRELKKAEVRVVDVNDYIAWKDGQYVFKEKPLAQVAKILRRWYNIEMVFESEAAREAVFTGVVRKEESIGLLADRLEATSSLTCRLEGQKIVIR